MSDTICCVTRNERITLNSTHTAQGYDLVRWVRESSPVKVTPTTANSIQSLIALRLEKNGQSCTSGAVLSEARMLSELNGEIIQGVTEFGHRGTTAFVAISAEVH